MAEITVFVPDGEFCSDKHHLDCIYADHSTTNGHWCDLFRERLPELESIHSDGELIRVRRKCNMCLSLMKNDGDDGIIVDRR